MIRFYAPNDPHGFFSNFSQHEVVIYGRTWPTSEHAFQAMKFHPHRLDLVAKVAETSTPGRAARLGRERAYPLRPDWDSYAGEMLSRIEGAKAAPAPGLFHNQEDGIHRMGVTAEPVLHRVKDVIMYEVVYAKFLQNTNLQQALRDTHDQVLIEAAEADPYWGWGCSRIGENKLGRILMAVRTSLRLGTGEGFPYVLDPCHEPLPERGTS